MHIICWKVWSFGTIKVSLSDVCSNILQITLIEGVGRAVGWIYAWEKGPQPFRCRDPNRRHLSLMRICHLRGIKLHRHTCACPLFYGHTSKLTPAFVNSLSGLDGNLFIKECVDFNTSFSLFWDLVDLMNWRGEHFLLMLDNDMVVNSRIYTGWGVLYYLRRQLKHVASEIKKISIREDQDKKGREINFFSTHPLKPHY